MAACPTCREAAAPHETNAFAPFCSRRCRLLDLGKWLDEGFRIVDEPSSDAPDASGPSDRSGS